MTLLSTILSIFVLSPPGTFVLPAQHLLPVLLFVLISLAVAMVSEALRKAPEHAAAAEGAKDLMMHELNHRIRNNLAMVASVLELQMRARNGDSQARQAFATAVARIHVIANAPRPSHAEGRPLRHRHEGDLTKCCRHLGDTLRDVRPIP
jgi:two-component sensor histidine kinase